MEKALPTNPRLIHSFIFAFILFILWGSNVPVYLLYGADTVKASATGESGFLAIRMIILFSYFILFAYGISRFREIWGVITNNLVFLLFMFFYFLSVFWSVDSLYSAFFLRTLMVNFIFIGICLLVLERKKAFLIMGYISCILLWISPIFAIWLPDIGIQQGSDEWTGVYSNKNTLAMFCSLTAGLLGLLGCSSKGKQRIFWFLNTGLAVLLLLYSGSATSFAALFAAAVFLALWVFLKSLRIFIIALLPLFIIATLLLTPVLFKVVFPWFLEAFNKDMTLTGRTDIWKAVLSVFMDRPFFGHGLKAFWRSEYGESRFPLEINGKIPAHSHNMFLDQLIEGGIVGALLFVLLMLVALWRAIKAVTNERDPALRYYPLYYFICVMIVGMAEVPLPEASFPMLLFLACFVKTGSQNKRLHA